MEDKSRIWGISDVKAFLISIITGFILLGVDGANTTMGLWHYKTGILMGVLSICHILKRFSVLYKTSTLHKFL